jgi:hypothetical protein
MIDPIRRAWHKVAGAFVSSLARKTTKVGGTPPPLGRTGQDTGSAIFKGAIGAIPVAGSILAEIVGQIIPEQRMERLEVYARYLNDRLDGMNVERTNMLMPESIELFEEGAIQSAHALSDQRREHIARLVAQGMTGDEKQKIEAKRLLNLLGQLEDDQIIILASHLQKNKTDFAFRRKHATLLAEHHSHINSSNDERAINTISKLATDHLIMLGLLKGHFEEPKKGEMPSFDRSTGMLKIRSYFVSPLGRVLLNRLGLADMDEF